MQRICQGGFFLFLLIFSYESLIFSHVYILSLETRTGIYYNVAYHKEKQCVMQNSECFAGAGTNSFVSERDRIPMKRR